MSLPILSREGEKRPVRLLSRLERETRETNGHIKRGVIRRDSRQYWFVAICEVVSSACETRETRPTAVLSRCLSLPLGERHARQDRVRGVFLDHPNGGGV